MNWDRARRQTGVSMRGNDVPHSNIESPDWTAAPRGKWVTAEQIQVPTTPGTVCYATRTLNGVVHVQWTPERGAVKRIAADRAAYIFYELRRQGRVRSLGQGFVGTISADHVDELDALFDQHLPKGFALGASWELFAHESVCWIRVARTRMPLDALIWRVTYRES